MKAHKPVTTRKPPPARHRRPPVPDHARRLAVRAALNQRKRE